MRLRTLFLVGAALAAVLLAIELPEIQRYVKMETM